MIPDPALMAVFLADFAHYDGGKTGPLPSVIAIRLIDKGYPAIVAGRVALTPPLAIEHGTEDDGSRPGRALAEDIERRTVGVVEALLFWQRWAP